MIADPCSADLIPGIYGDKEGLLARVKSTITCDAEAATTCGYILWSPDYHEDGTKMQDTDVTAFGNVFGWSADDPEQRPANIQAGAGALKFGTSGIAFADGGVSQTATAFADPASELLSSDIVQDARTIGACIKMVYTGTALTASGQFALIQDLPLAGLVGNTTDPDDYDGEVLASSVNQLFRLATHTGRLGTNDLECIARPDDSSHVFRGINEGPYKCYTGQAITPEEVKLNTAATAQAKTLEPQWFGFAWRGLDTSAKTPLIFDLYKSLEWRPRPSSGFTLADKTTMHTDSQVKKATLLLDQKVPLWTAPHPVNPTGGKRTLENIIAGVGNIMTHPLSRRLAQSAYQVGRENLQMIEDVAPLARMLL